MDVQVNIVESMEEDDFVLVISFAGEDCEGPHTNDSIALSKVRKFLFT